MKKILFALYIVVILCMGIATLVEKYQGTEYVASHIYSSWWFSALWALLTAVAVAWFVSRKVKRISVVLLHLSFVVILLGALLTHLTATQGMMHLRVGETTRQYVSQGEPHDSVLLPFSVRLDKFTTRYHEGTRAASDYISTLTLFHGDQRVRGAVSMNKILSFHNIRFYQSSFDEDMHGSYLAENSDPYGIPVTYTGYALLFISLLWMLADPKGAYRKIIRNVGKMEKDGPDRESLPVHRPAKPATYRCSAALTAVIAFVVIAVIGLKKGYSEKPTAHVLPQETAAEFGKLAILYNDRICPLQTFALDFTKKLYGKRSYRGLSTEQVLTGFIFWGEEWSRDPIIKTKGAERSQWQLPKYNSVNTFFNEDMGGYILGPDLQEYYQGNNDKYHQELAKTDDKLSLIMQLRQVKPLKIFPFMGVWYSPTDKKPANMEPERQEYMTNIFALLYQDALAGNFSEMNEALHKMQKYQRTFGGNSLPSATKVKAERIYKRLPIATILFMVNLTMAFLYMLFIRPKWNWVKLPVLILSFLALTFCLSLRWIISGNIPMSNGYETMLLMAWIVMLVSMLTFSRFPVIIPFGFLLSGFFLLVSHISQMDPQITHLMPVLSSPLLTLHVCIIMAAYALLSVTFVCALAGIMKKGDKGTQSPLYLLSQLFLYPAIACLGFGIFIGAIWANVSWGTYWSWDPKDTWALITFMVYGVSVHTKALPWLARPRSYHLFMILAFLTIFMTYFGVNYFLGGMHSYA